MAGSTTEPQAIADAAKCLLCLPEPTHLEIQTYLIAVLAGGSTDPQVLASAASELQGLTGENLSNVLLYLLCNQAGLGDCSAQAIVDSALCYECLPPQMQMAGTTYLLAQKAGVTTDPAELAELARCYSCYGPSTLAQMQVYLLRGMAAIDCPANDTMPALGPLVPPPTPPPPSTCTDIPADQIPLLSPTYVAGALTSIGVLFPQVCCTPSHLAIYEADDDIGTGAVAWMNVSINVSHAGEINYSRTIPVVLPITKSYLIAKQVCEGGVESGFSNGIEAIEIDPIVVDWADRVVVNGGDPVSQGTRIGMSTFIDTLDSAGLLAKIKWMNVFAPDSLTACRTPLVAGGGLVLMTNNGPFVAGDLTVNGLIGNGSTKELGVGLSSLQAFSNSQNLGTLAVYVSATSGIGMGFGGGASSTAYMIRPAFATEAYVAAPYGIVGNGAIIGSAGGTGYFMASRTASNLMTAYMAKSTFPHASIGSTAWGMAADYRDASLLWTHSLGGNTFGAHRISFAMLSAEGWTSAQSLALYNAVQALRTALGGGYV